MHRGLHNNALCTYNGQIRHIYNMDMDQMYMHFEKTVNIETAQGVGSSFPSNALFGALRRLGKGQVRIWVHAVLFNITTGFLYEDKLSARLSHSE